MLADNKTAPWYKGEDTVDDLTPAYLGARLARMRLQLGQSRHEEITQRRLAHALDIKPQAYNSWEQGKALPRLDHLRRLARYYRVSLDRLCGYERDAEATGGIEWTSLRRPESEEDEQALELFYQAAAGTVGDVPESKVAVAIRHVIYSQSSVGVRPQHCGIRSQPRFLTDTAFPHRPSQTRAQSTRAREY